MCVCTAKCISQYKYPDLNFKVLIIIINIHCHCRLKIA